MNTNNKSLLKHLREIWFVMSYTVLTVNDLHEHNLKENKIKMLLQRIPRGFHYSFEALRWHVLFQITNSVNIMDY